MICIQISSLVAQTVKRLPATRETRIQSLSWEDVLEKRIAAHSSILAWKIPWTEEWWVTVHGVAKSWTQQSDFTFILFKIITFLFNFVFLTFMIFYLHHRETALFFVHHP